MRNDVKHWHELTTKCDRCHRFLNTHSRASVGKSKPTVELDGRMKALLNTTTYTILWKVIINCAVLRSIRSCWRFTSDAVRIIKEQQKRTLIMSEPRSESLATIYEGARSLIMDPQSRSFSNALPSLDVEIKTMVISDSGRYYNKNMHK